MRADIDGAARTTLTVGAGYRTQRFEVNAGFGAVLEGTNDNPGECNPTSSIPSMLGCNGDGNEDPIDEREGPGSDQPTEQPRYPAPGAREPGRVSLALPDVHARRVDLVLAGFSGGACGTFTANEAPAVWLVGRLLVPVAAQRADAGGLLLPGAGAVSTSRAGAAVASADDGEALATRLSSQLAQLTW